jgi:nucleoid DNA-binding protein
MKTCSPTCISRRLPLLVQKEVEAGNSVFMRGFGTFEPKLRRQKIGQTKLATGQGQKMVIPECYIPHFKPCKEFKNNVKNNFNG